VLFLFQIVITLYCSVESFNKARELKMAPGAGSRARSRQNRTRRQSSALASPLPASDGTVRYGGTAEICDEVAPDEEEDLYIEIDDEDDEVVLNSAENSIGMSIDDYLANEKSKIVAVSSWKDVDCQVATGTIGEATEIVWKEGKDEIDFFRRKVFQPKFGTLSPSILQISSLLLSSEGSIAQLFQHRLKWSIPRFTKFLRTFFVQSAYRLSVTAMYSNESYLKTHTLMDKGEYVALWREIGTACLPDDQATHSHVSGQTFWAGVEASLNEDLSTNVMPSFLADDQVEQFRAIFDDDKMHYNLKKGKPSASLKQSQHVRDNRKGPVCHHSVLSASGVLLGCSFERPGDTTTSCTQRIVRKQIVPMQGGDNLKLAGLAVGGDRAYQNKELLFDFFLPAGAKVLGTRPRSKDCPFYFGNTLDAKDKRQNVPMNGAKTLLIKKVRLFMLAIRS
jgi:hypothetical protein